MRIISYSRIPPNIPVILILLYDCVFSIQNNSKSIALSYEMDLDFEGYFRKGKSLSCN